MDDDTLQQNTPEHTHQPTTPFDFYYDPQRFDQLSREADEYNGPAKSDARYWLERAGLEVQDEFSDDDAALRFPENNTTTSPPTDINEFTTTLQSPRSRNVLGLTDANLSTLLE